MWQHVKLSDVSLETRPLYSLVVDQDVKKPTKQTNFRLIEKGCRFSVSTCFKFLAYYFPSIVQCSSQGIEDYMGDMDFKMSASATGLTALQVNIYIYQIVLYIVSCNYK